MVLATDLKGTDWSYVSQYIHVWDSADLRTFTGYRRLKLHDMNTHCWAPEAFWDAGRGQYAIIYSAVNSSGHNVIMVNYTTDFLTASAPQVFFDPGYDVIDGDMAVGVNGVNYMYFKKNQTLVGTRSTSLDPGSFKEFTTGVAHGGTEAPTLVKSLTSSTWYLWGDTYTPNGVFYAWQSTDLASGTWTALDQKTYTQPLNSKHCGITTITTAQYDNLITKWGAPAWNRLKSYNLPARYIRHSNYIGRIDEYPIDPPSDSQWKLVPGLADPMRRLVPVGQVPDEVPAPLQLPAPARRQRRHVDVLGGRDLLPHGGPGGRELGVVPLVQLPDPVHPPLELRAAHRPDLHDHGAAGRHFPRRILTREDTRMAHGSVRR